VLLHPVLDRFRAVPHVAEVPVDPPHEAIPAVPISRATV
jgi:hypothetical protein